MKLISGIQNGNQQATINSGMKPATELINFNSSRTSFQE